MKYNELTAKHNNDAGLALLLILIILYYFIKEIYIIHILLAVTLINMIIPIIFKPFSFLWFNFSELLGSVVSKFVLFIIYSIVVVPVGLLRHLSGKDTLLLKKFKTSSESVLMKKNHTYTSEDVKNPY
jgi:phosphoglycerol transferase MdoB-like AlkP superfamily enzyme